MNVIVHAYILYIHSCCACTYTVFGSTFSGGSLSCPACELLLCDFSHQFLGHWIMRRQCTVATHNSTSATDECPYVGHCNDYPHTRKLVVDAVDVLPDVTRARDPNWKLSGAI